MRKCSLRAPGIATATQGSAEARVAAAEQECAEQLREAAESQANARGGEMQQEAAEAAKAKAGRLKQQAANLQHEASLNSLAAHLLKDDARDPAWLGGIEGTGGNDQLLLSPKRHLNEHHLGSMNGIRVCMVCA